MAHTINSRLRSAALAAMVVFAAAPAASAAIVVGLVLDPMTTAGASADVSSIYSGLGTWHMFALDDSDDDFGISSYNIELTGATAIHHSSPSTFGLGDNNGDFHDAGFGLLREASGGTGLSSIHASQPLPGQSPYLITGLGQQAGSFASMAGGGAPSSTTSPSWGNYSTVAPLNGKNWLFLAEGKYNQGAPPVISQANFTVYNNPSTFGSSYSRSAIVPEPITPSLLTPDYVAHLTAPPTLPAANNPPSAFSPAPVQPNVARSPSDAVVVGMVAHPASSPGSPGTWQIFAVDNGTGSYGISSYNVDVVGALSARNASPSTRAIQDTDGNQVEGGFTLLRGVDAGAPGAYSIHASQGLPGQSPLLIPGFGQNSGTFASEATAKLGVPAQPTSSSSDWGNYSTVSPLNGKSWLLLAEGTYDTPAPPTIAGASITVYSNPDTFTSIFSPSTIVPDPITPTLLTNDYFAHLTPRAPATVEPPRTSIAPPAPPIINPPPVVDVPPTLLPPGVEPSRPPKAVADPPPLVAPPRSALDPSTNSDPDEGGWVVIGDPSFGEPGQIMPIYCWSVAAPITIPFSENQDGTGAYAVRTFESVRDLWALQRRSIDGTSEAGIFPAFTTVSYDILTNSVLGDSVMASSFSAVSDGAEARDAVSAPEPQGFVLMILAQFALCVVARGRR